MTLTFIACVLSWLFSFLNFFFATPQILLVFFFLKSIFTFCFHTMFPVFVDAKEMMSLFWNTASFHSQSNTFPNTFLCLSVFLVESPFFCQLINFFPHFFLLGIFPNSVIDFRRQWWNFSYSFFFYWKMRSALEDSRLITSALFPSRAHSFCIGWS